MRAHVFMAGSIPLIFGLACGSADPPTKGVATPYIETYQSLAFEVQASVMSYGDAMAVAPQPEACRAALDAYDAEVRPRIARMVDMSKGMDAFMMTHAGETLADMRCVADTMTNELDYHRSVACTSPSAASNRVEMQRHVGAMSTYDNHVQDRCQTMMDVTSGVPKWSPVFQGCQNWDGRCSSMMHGDCAVTTRPRTE